MKELMYNNQYMYTSHHYEEPDEFLMDDMPFYIKERSATVLPIKKNKGGVLDAKGNFVALSGYGQESPFFLTIDGAYSIKQDEIDTKYANEKVIYLGGFYNHWGHYLVDCLSRCWILLREEFSGYKVLFLPFENQKLKGNYKKLLELLGVTDDRIIHIDKPSVFNEVVIPEIAHDTCKFKYKKEYVEIFDRILTNYCLMPEIPEKVYFSRENIGKFEFGEAEIAENFRRNGYTVYYPEQLSLDDQISIYANAKEIVCLNSTICLNALFSPEDTQWVIINKYSAYHKMFAEVCAMRSLYKPIFIDAYDEKYNFYGNEIGSVPYMVSFNENIKSFFEDRKMNYHLFDEKYRKANIKQYKRCCLKKKYGLDKIYPFILKLVGGLKNFLIAHHMGNVYAVLKKIKSLGK